MRAGWLAWRDDELVHLVDGERWRWTGRRWQSAGLARPLAAALDAQGVPTRRAVQLEQAGARVRAVARWWPDDDSPTLAIGSDDGGHTWLIPPAPGLRFIAGWAR